MDVKQEIFDNEDYLWYTDVVVILTKFIKTQRKRPH